jgi:hypothetical protein
MNQALLPMFCCVSPSINGAFHKWGEKLHKIDGKNMFKMEFLKKCPLKCMI